MAQQSQGQGGDNSLAPVWITVLVFITAWAIWTLGHQHIVSFVFFLNIWEGKLINLFLNNPLLQEQITLMQTVPTAGVDWSTMVTMTKEIGDYMRYPIALILIVLATLLYKSNLILKYKKAHNMNTLRAQEQFNWPAIMPIVKEDLVSQDVNQGPWAMALTPMEFARKHKLLRKDDALLDNQMPGMEMTAGLRKGDAKRVFTMQLGPYWEGFEHCSPQAYALCAVFMARMNRDRDGANLILHTLDKTYVAGKPDFSVARPIMKKYQNTEGVQEIVAKHAYVLTVISSLLTAARNDGVVPSSEFLWLKPVDRRLWYMLNCVGRQTPYAEVAGPFAHWRAERELGRRSLVPMIDEAIRALEIAIKEVKLSPRQMEELEP
ncbi:type IVB secretion system coupling complex protein DotM/IcmP [Legionella sp. km772]|uniref:type IVB secretion system coupling complex protein DotM/IcmP n=1 Tax=Legionella sp. km772 TaxID=2498111 RepID=UPI000F8D7593|nr:type IVB secretion system coupling complex protein DotM/IcmP [Legionella sp. km772]RUR12249.1 phosphoesterase [Legionella sp. km772]